MIFAALQEEATEGFLLFFVYWGGDVPHMRRAEGERPELCISAMGTRVSG